MKMKKVLSILLVFTIVLMFFGCQASGSKDPYKFALFAPMTGDNAQYGQTYKATIDIYLEKINKEGGIKGHPVEVVIFDDKNDAKEALNIANLIVSDSKIIAAIGSQTSSCGLAAAPVFQAAGIPMITPQGSHPNLTLTGNYIFRMVALNTYEGGVIAQNMIKDGYKKLAVIYANDDYGVSIVKYWTSIVEKGGAQIVASENFIAGQTKDFTPLLSKIKAAGADAIYIEPSYSDASAILAQMKQLDCKFQPYGSSMLYKQEFIDLAKENAEGLQLVNFTRPDNKEANYVFISEKYKEKTGKITDVYVTNSYDCIALLCDAVKAVGTKGADIVKWMASVKDWQGSSGVINFDENRNPSKILYRYNVTGGKFVLMDK